MLAFNLIEQLKNPDFYPHSVKLPIEIIQTHASILVLTGEYAYKLKKPVNYGFLDFSTLDKRKFFLEQELTLNQPIAPDIYIEVLPINQANNHLTLDGNGEAIEYVLKMHQFPQACLSIDLFEQGKLTENHLEELGKVVAKFHQQALTNDYITQFGDLEVIEQAIDDNYLQSQKYIGSVQNQKQYDETKAFTDNFFLNHPTFFKQRQNEQKIKECHGDLHLKNICFWKDKIQLFDRIEFNETFRFVDVMYDIGFTVMDLEARNRKDLANIFLNTYLEQTGDWNGLNVLPFYLSRQAYVRAKVNSLLLDETTISEAEKETATQEARHYYQLAWEYTKRPTGRLILMSGLSGSGKTTVAKAIARHLNAIHIRSDAVRKQIAGIPLEQKGTENTYTPEMTQKTYDRLLKLGEMLIRQSYSVILDAKYDRRHWRQAAINLAQTLQHPLHIIFCTAPSDILIQRLDRRTQDISDANADLLKEQQATAEPFNENEHPYLISIDTNRSDWLNELKTRLD